MGGGLNMIEPIKLVCPKCRHGWLYSGSKGYAPWPERTKCSICGFNVKVVRGDKS